MGVDYYSCHNCGETFPDCGTYICCEHGHMIGPCCFPPLPGHKYRRMERWPEDQTTEDNPDYGRCVLERFCPVCAKGGSEAEQLKKAQDTIVSLKERLADAKKNEAVCHCGAVLSEHTQSDNHGPVPMEHPCPNAEKVQLLETVIADIKRHTDACSDGVGRFIRERIAMFEGEAKS